ncbi:Zn-ribbon domain-containing OB-fold protein [Pseudarthrobacter sulfonivorans]|uniref:Zn-ribbon domain-containing OB-fold protein n=1 Tax=Pseudarthrobacter sulfonivorans TaxID=121292 RepID=UPI00389A337C
MDAAAGPAPHLHPDIAGFWSSLDHGQLSLQRCGSCETLRFPISPNCHECLSSDFSWEPIEPRGTVNVAIQAHEAVSKLPASGISLSEPWRGMTPYLSGVVDMDAGVRLPGRIVCRCGDALIPGTEVNAVLLDAAQDITIYGFLHECETTRRTK